MDGAAIWRNGGEIESLRELLVADYGLGEALAGWSLSTATAISADGRTMVGNGINPDGNLEAWLVRFDAAPVPEPATMTLAASAAMLALASRIRRRA